MEQPDISDISMTTNYEARQKLLNNVITNAPNWKGEENLSLGRKNLRKWLGKAFRVKITDGRVLIGYFNCTDRDSNLVLSMCSEYLEEGNDARILGNVMIPGKHIVSISVDMKRDDPL